VFAPAARSVHDNSYHTADEKSELQTALTAAKLIEQEAVSNAQRFEAELSDLAGAYNNLEVHSYQLEAQIKRLQTQAAQAPSTAGQIQDCPHCRAKPAAAHSACCRAWEHAVIKTFFCSSHLSAQRACITLQC